MRCWSVLVGLAMVAAACTDGEQPAAPSPEVVERVEWEATFEEAGTNGTFAVREVGSAETLVAERTRAETRFLPASTFKILNSLVILETGTVESVDEIVEWDGIDRGIDVWNQDHSLRSGIEASAVWLYQEHARTVGETRMAELVAAADYGNADISGDIDRFWLDGALRITALEQLDVLEALMTDALPFTPDHQAAVRDILVREDGDGWRWLHKTGTALAAEPILGWLVGATEHDGRRWIFALNLDLETIGPDGVATQIDPQLRIELARELLVEVGALPAG